MKIHHDLRLPSGNKKDLRNKRLSIVQECRFPESELTLLKTALSRSFSHPKKQDQDLEVIFEQKNFQIIDLPGGPITLHDLSASDVSSEPINAQEEKMLLDSLFSPEHEKVLCREAKKRTMTAEQVWARLGEEVFEAMDPLLAL